MKTTRSKTLGPESRPVAIPDDFGPHSVSHAKGTVTLHNGLWWSGEPMTLNLDSQDDRIRLYEIVLSEGSTADVTEFISFSELVSLWPSLYLPRHVRRAWAAWFRDQGTALA
jgi:hypothetical protein